MGTTIGVDFRFKNLPVDKKTIKLQLWDTAGQERFRTITSAYYRGADGILLVYDITDKQSFTNINTWIRSIEQNADDSISKIIIGNKCDLLEDRVVISEHGKILANQFNVPFYETSAKNDINVQKVFIDVARTIMKNKFPDEDEEELNLSKRRKRKESTIKLHMNRDKKSKNVDARLLFRDSCYKWFDFIVCLRVFALF